MKEDDFLFYKSLLQEKSGLFLTPEKTYLLSTRLTPLSKTLGYASLEEYTRFLRHAGDQAAHDIVIQAMTTNETSFFRDIKPFQLLRSKLLPWAMDRRKGKKALRIWSAACSTGQEAYSIAMILRELGEQTEEWNLEILGTDIADSVLQQAQSGIFNNFEIQRGLSMPQIVRNFTQAGNMWTVKDELRRFVRFRKFNLLDSPSRLGAFDIIFCRNVLIYFDQETKLQVLRSLYMALPDDGILLLGSCENVMADKTNFCAIDGMHGVYIKKHAEDIFKAA